MAESPPQALLRSEALLHCAGTRIASGLVDHVHLRNILPGGSFASGIWNRTAPRPAAAFPIWSRAPEARCRPSARPTADRTRRYVGDLAVRVHGRIVNLEVHVHGLILAKHAGDAGDDLGVILHQRMRREQLLVVVRRAPTAAVPPPSDCSRPRNSTAGIFAAVQIRDGEFGFEGPHLAALIFARQEAKRVGARAPASSRRRIADAAGRSWRHFLRSSLTVILSRTPETSLPVASRTWPMKSRSAVCFVAFLASPTADPGIFTEIGTK